MICCDGVGEASWDDEWLGGCLKYGEHGITESVYDILPEILRSLAACRRIIFSLANTTYYTTVTNIPPSTLLTATVLTM